MKIILASGSPRRAQILTEHQILFEVDPADIVEQVEPVWTPEECAVNLAYQKAQVVRERRTNDEEVVLAADTVVALENDIYGKPVDENDAYQMLKVLSHNRHRVITGICLWPLDSEPIKKFETTFVEMVPMSDQEIHDYIETGSCFDKAGGYGIQDFSDQRISKIEGDFNNVVGLPAQLVLSELSSL